jgi:hypothetical protein
MAASLGESWLWPPLTGPLPATARRVAEPANHRGDDSGGQRGFVVACSMVEPVELNHSRAALGQRHACSSEAGCLGAVISSGIEEPGTSHRGQFCSPVEACKPAPERTRGYRYPLLALHPGHPGSCRLSNEREATGDHRRYSRAGPGYRGCHSASLGVAPDGEPSRLLAVSHGEDLLMYPCIRVLSRSIACAKAQRFHLDHPVLTGQEPKVPVVLRVTVWLH